MVKMYIVLLYTPALLLRYSEAGSCRNIPMPMPLPETSSKFLIGHAYITLKKNMLVQCAMRCMQQRKCASFNYDAKGKKCDLNDMTHITSPGSLQPTQTYDVVYYAISQWDEDWLGNCKNHDCPNETVCQSITGSTHESRKCMSTYSSDVTSPIYYESTPICTWTTGCENCYLTGEYAGRSYSAVGCYYNTDKTLPTLMFSRRGSIILDELGFFTDLVGTCAEHSTDYELFGIEFHGECYASNNSTANFASANSIMPDKCTLECMYKGDGVGSDNVMFIYAWDL